MLEDILFCIIVLIHVLIWMFVLLAFLNKSTAYINLYYVIPIIYVLHILPFHILNQVKQNIYEEDWKSKNDKILETMIFPKLFNDCRSYLENNCTFSPLTPQGIMIFGLISCIYTLYPISYNEDFQKVKSYFSQ